MLLKPTPTQVISTFSPPFLSSSSGGLASILNMIWKKSLICRRNSTLDKRVTEERFQIVSMKSKCWLYAGLNWLAVFLKPRHMRGDSTDDTSDEN